MVETTDCQGCRDGAAFALPITMAFQPIVDVDSRTVFAHEALVRGADGAGAFAVLSTVDDANRVAFDRACRTKAIEMAGALDLIGDGSALSINFLPNAVHDPARCVLPTLELVAAARVPTSRIIFEFTETEQVEPAHLNAILRTYKALGFLTAIDDFGAGYSGLTLLSRFQPDIVKLDMALIRGLDADRVKRAIVRAIVRLAADLGVAVVAEGIETEREYLAWQDMGVRLLQGYLFARPAFEAIATPDWPAAVPAQRKTAQAA